MKTCYMCGGKLEKTFTDINIKEVVIKAMPAEVCTICGEKYFDTKTATFIQETAKYIDTKRKEYFIDIISEKQNAIRAI
ncbi:MAG: YgiT-type zinc finger protein [Methanosarcinales archaeon]